MGSDTKSTTRNTFGFIDVSRYIKTYSWRKYKHSVKFYSHFSCLQWMQESAIIYQMNHKFYQSINNNWILIIGM